MKERTRYGRRPCRGCGRMISTNALGRAAHERACKGREAERAAAEERAHKRSLESVNFYRKETMA